MSPRNANILLLVAAAIWGFAFVAQRVGMRFVEPLTFNGVRFLLGAAALAPLAWRGPLAPREVTAAERRRALRYGLLTGLILFGGATLQQIGVVYTTAGKAGFITGLYVVFVPLLGLLIGQRTGRLTWTGAVIAAGGLYLLSARGPLDLAPGDGFVLAGALFWAAHVLAISRFVHGVPVLYLAVTQFTVCGGLSLAGAFVFETPRIGDLVQATLPILYAGLLSVAVAYTLQVLAQRRARPAPAAIILSFEAVFAAVGGWAVLGETLGVRGLIGCALMLAGVLLAQAGDLRRPVPTGNQPVNE